MGQAANNRGRNASLDSKKERAAGRGTRATERDFDEPQPGTGRTLGAFGEGNTRRPKPKSKKR
jgi:hypothetical protein